MSQELIARSEDLIRLASAYSVHVVDPSFLVIEGIPYLTASGDVGNASLIMVLTLQGDVTTKPADHVIYWTGEYPRRANGQTLDTLGGGNSDLAPFGTVIMFSARAAYTDHHHKACTYIEIISREVRKRKHAEE